ALAPRSPVAEGRDHRNNEIGIERPQLLYAQAGEFKLRSCQIGYEDIRSGQKPAKRFPTVVRIEIDHDAELVCVQIRKEAAGLRVFPATGKRAASPGRIAGRTLDLD